jgi:hypothetical protein
MTRRTLLLTAAQMMDASHGRAAVPAREVDDPLLASLHLVAPTDGLEEAVAYGNRTARQLVGVFISASHCRQTAEGCPSRVFPLMVPPGCDRTPARFVSPAAQVDGPTLDHVVALGEV